MTETTNTITSSGLKIPLTINEIVTLTQLSADKVTELLNDPELESFWSLIYWLAAESAED